ncbi:hypothetical protein PCE1_002866 [Barthelona sp. PCE]
MENVIRQRAIVDLEEDRLIEEMGKSKKRDVLVIFRVLDIEQQNRIVLKLLKGLETTTKLDVCEHILLMVISHLNISLRDSVLQRLESLRYTSKYDTTRRAALRIIFEITK